MSFTAWKIQLKKCLFNFRLGKLQHLLLYAKLCRRLQSHLTPLRPKLHIRNSSRATITDHFKIKLNCLFPIQRISGRVFVSNSIALPRFVPLAFRSFRCLLSIVSKTYEQKHTHTFYLFVCFVLVRRRLYKWEA